MNLKEMNTKDLLKLFQKEWKKFENMKSKEKELGGGSYFSRSYEQKKTWYPLQKNGYTKISY